MAKAGQNRMMRKAYTSPKSKAQQRREERAFGTRIKLYKKFVAKKQAQHIAKAMRYQGVQYVRVRKTSSGGRIRWGVYLGGKNSRAHVSGW